MNRAELVTKLELVSPALAGNNLVPLFQAFCFDTKTVSAYSDTLGIVAPCKTTEAFAVNGVTLLGLLKNSHADEVEFTIEDKQDVGIKTGKSRFKLPYFTQEEFLFKPPTDKWLAQVAVTEQFLKGLEACLLTSSRDTAQAALLGVCLKDYDAKKMALYSCDGDSITRFVTGDKSTGIEPCLMPNVFCEAVIRTVKETKCETGVLKVGKEWAVAELQTGYNIYGRLIEVDEPLDYETEISNTLKTKKVVFVEAPKGLDHALSRARVIADAESAKTVLDVAEGKLRLTTETHMGVVKDVLPFKHADVVAELSAGMMQRAIGLCSEVVVLEGCTVYRDGTTLFMVVGNMG